MKKLIFFILLLTQNIFSANSFIGETKVQKYFNFDDFSLVVLENRFILKVFHVNQRWRTIGEWWRKEDLTIDREFIWEKSSWQSFDEIEITKNDMYDLVENKISEKDKKKLLEYPFIAKNLNSGKIAFVKKLHIIELVDYLKDNIKHQYEKGYAIGYSTGYGIGKQNAMDTYKEKNYKETYNYHGDTKTSDPQDTYNEASDLNYYDTSNPSSSQSGYSSPSGIEYEEDYSPSAPDYEG